jgi:putative transcriptional regulator
MSEAHKIKFKIKELLDERGKSLYWLSKQTNTAYSTVHKLANDKTDSISFVVLDKLCDALECEPCELIFRETNKNQSVS